MTSKIGPPLWLLAELTYRCPLQCPYCSNPLDLLTGISELNTEEWQRILSEARALGAAQLGFSGGEPLVRQDLEVLVAHARGLGFYTNLITSGVGLSRERVLALKDAGLDHVQISFQSTDEELSELISGSGKAHAQKVAMAKAVKEAGYPMVLNFVLHRHNIDQVAEIIALAESLSADYLELANTQYHGWALQNREALLPSRQQIEAAETAVNNWRQANPGGMKLFFVVPDYFEERPKPCMNGWGSMFLTVTPEGRALPCHSAAALPIDFPDLRTESVSQAWYESPGFNHYRGEDWMQEPCRQCPERDRDFGGCRCQAFALTGDAAAADPVCTLSPHRSLIDEALAMAGSHRQRPPSPLLFRTLANSKDLIASSGSL